MKWPKLEWGEWLLAVGGAIGVLWYLFLVTYYLAGYTHG